MMRDVPAIFVLATHTGQVRPDPPGAEEVRTVIGVFPGLGHRAPTKCLPRDRTDILRMTVPAALPDIDAPPAKLQRRILGHLDLLFSDDVIDRRHTGAG